MEQSCYRCGAKFEEGIAFCPQCNAPQIRVVTQQSGQPVGLPEASAPVLHYPVAPARSTIEWPEALAAAAMADLIAGLLFVFVLGLPLGLGVLAAGFLAVAFYRRRRPFAQLGPGLGLRLGSLSGALAFGILSASLAAAVAVFHSWHQVQQKLLEMLREASTHNPYPIPPEVMEFVQTPAGFVAFLAMTLIALMIFACLGGVIGGLLLRRNKPPGMNQS